MFHYVWKILVFTLITHHATAFICLNQFDDCPKEQCTEQSTAPCKCPSTDTYCDFSVETCAGTYANCIQIKIVTAFAFYPLSTFTSYATTISTYSTIDTEIQYSTDIQTMDVVSTVLFTETTTKTITQPSAARKLVTRGPAKISAKKALQKRVVVGTSTRVTTITDESRCYTVQEPECTPTEYGGTSTYFYPTTTTIYSTRVSAQQNLAAVTSTVLETETMTMAESAVETTSGTFTIADDTSQDATTGFGTAETTRPGSGGAVDTDSATNTNGSQSSRTSMGFAYITLMGGLLVIFISSLLVS